MHGPSQLGGLLVSSDQTLAMAGLEDRGYIRLELGPLPTSLELDVSTRCVGRDTVDATPAHTMSVQVLVTLVHNQKR